MPRSTVGFTRLTSEAVVVTHAFQGTGTAASHALFHGRDIAAEYGSV
jgi:hypothetical protein